MPKRALLSVSDKAGLAAFARGLVRLDYELYSTGGTLRALEEASLDVRSVSELTGFPEILDGRVKTLHPAIHGGLLARRDEPAHLETLERHGLVPIDLVCVNLYPFAETAARPDAEFEDVLEQIDIGGPSMIRSAAKNHRSVIVVVRPERYGDVLAGLGKNGELDADFRLRLAAEAFGHTAAYDTMIAAWLRRDEAFPTELSIGGSLAQQLRYGENPHQQAAFYRIGGTRGGLGAAEQLQGTDLSFNNLQDASAAFELAAEFDRPAAAIIKHTNPCGLAVGSTIAEAYAKAFDCDRVSAFGGVVALNRPLDAATAAEIGSIFVEVVIAPSVEVEAAEVLREKPKVRVLAASPAPNPGFHIRSVPGGFLAQTWDARGFDRRICRIASERQPTEEEWDQLEIAWLTAKHVKSNAIVLAREGAAVGIGAGQMSRVEAAQLAAQRAGERARGSVMASDAFFPFPDGVEAGIRAGITAIIQPGGSMRDAEAVAAADQAGAAMVMTGERHFRH